MKHQVQKPGECFPTVVSMLSGIPVDQLIREALQAVDCEWYSWSFAIEKFACEEEGRVQLQKMSDAIVKHVPWMKHAMFRPVAEVNITNALPWREVRPKLTGRGALSIFNLYWVHQAHIVAYEHDMIFDPAHFAPTDFRSWRNFNDMRGWAAYGVWPEVNE